MSQDTYYNDHYTAQCYVNRPRVVPVDQGDSYLAASLSVKHGKKDDQGRPKFTQQLDTRVVGSQAKSMVEALIELIDSQPNDFRPVISASVKAGDIQPGKSYTVKRGPNEGEIVTPLRGRLVKLTHVYVNGDRFREDLDGDGDPAMTDESDNAGDTQPQAGEADQSQPSEAEKIKLEPEIKLSENDPEFQIKREQLQQRGYTFDWDKMLWIAPVKASNTSSVPGAAASTAAALNAAIVFMPLASFLL